MNMTPRLLAMLAGLLLLVLVLTSCATSLPPMQATPVAPPRIPSPPAISAPQPSGSYWQEHCSLMQATQALLNQTGMPSEPC